MFKKGWLYRGRIYSDEGFSVGIADLSHLVYRENRRKMTIGGELGANGFVVSKEKVGPWDDGEVISEEKRLQVIDRARRALESQGIIFDLAE